MLETLLNRTSQVLEPVLGALVDGVANRFLPSVEAAACYWRCTYQYCAFGTPAGVYPARIECEYCNGYWTSNCRCNPYNCPAYG
jgi:hypothetical protein